MRRLLVTGASGYLGAYLVGAAHAAKAPGWDASGTFFSQSRPAALVPMRQLDLRDPQAVRQLLAEVGPDAVIHTACSNRDEPSINAIVPAARNLAAACHESGIRLVHVSTDLVFDGEHAPYADDSPLGPIMPYGQAKSEAEVAVSNLCPEGIIVRPSLIWAFDPPDRQTAWLVDGLRRGAPVTLFTDEIRCPVHLPDLAAALLELAALTREAGPFNLGGGQALNRWDFGRRLLNALGLAGAKNVRPGTVAASRLARPRNLTLECRRADQVLATRLRGVDEVLASQLGGAFQPRRRAG